MNNKLKTIDISGVKYAMASELGENHAFLERLADAGKVGKVNWNGNNYYEVAKVKQAGTDMRTIPPGYVRAVDHAVLLGSDRRTASELCAKTNAPAKKIIVGGAKASWFADKAWLEKQIGKTIEPPKPAPAIVNSNHTSVQGPSLAELQATIQELRGVVQTLVRGAAASPRRLSAPSVVTEKAARAQGYRTVQELSKELEVPRQTLLGWKARGQVRYHRVTGRVFLHVEDTEKMYLRLDENRAIITARMGGRSNNKMNKATPNGVS